MNHSGLSFTVLGVFQLTCSSLKPENKIDRRYYSAYSQNPELFPF